ncbi:MAG: tetratricopeptide repeat protein [Acidobacteriaceae bacterium]|nr:tetratricopeptide repeat protein [Acidobacteriaceae bacterium]
MTAEAHKAAETALQLDPTVAAAFNALACVRGSHDWEWEESERLYREAIRLNPGYAIAHQWLGGDNLAVRGRLEEAHAELDIACRLDPLSGIIRESKGLAFLYERDYERALEVYREVLELDPYYYRIHSAIGRALAQSGRYAEAIHHLELARVRCGEPPNVLAVLGQTYAWQGKITEARAILSRLSQLAAQQPVSPASFALIHIGLGEKEQALNLLERALNERNWRVITLKVHPAYDPLRGEPRYQALLKKIGLSD